jgi:hypothetical protein
MELILAGARRPNRDVVRTRTAGVIVLVLSLSRPAFAASVPWTPSVTARNAIEVLVDDGGLQLTVSQWPLPRNAVQQALDALPQALPPALADARALVQAELHAQQVGLVSLTVRERSDALSGFGDDATLGSSLLLRTGELDGPHLAMQIGGRLDPVSVTGQYRTTASAFNALRHRARSRHGFLGWAPGTSTSSSRGPKAS